MNKFFLRLRDLVDHFFFSPASPAPLGLLRVGLALLMMLEWAQLWGSFAELFGSHGFLQADLMDIVSGKSVASYADWFGAHGMNFSALLTGFYFVRWALLILFALGFFPRAVTILLWLCQVGLMSSGSFSVYGVDRYFQMLLFLLVFAPTGEAFSFSRWLHGEKTAEDSVAAQFVLRAIQLCLLITYVNAGLAKASGEQWWTGDAVWRSVHLPEFQTGNFYWMAAVPIVPKLLALSTLLFETFYIVAVWIPWIGIAWALAVIGMHLGIAFFLGLFTFGISMAFVNFAVFIYPRREFAVMKKWFWGRAR